MKRQMFGRDKIILHGFKVVQLSRYVQKDGLYCGVMDKTNCQQNLIVHFTLGHCILVNTCFLWILHTGYTCSSYLLHSNIVSFRTI